MEPSEDFQKAFEQAFLEARRRDYPVKEIKSKLLEQGYDKQLLNNLIIKFYFKKTIKITFFTLALILLLILLTYFLLPEACETPACFIKAANECDPKVYENVEGGSLIKYTITADCFLIKRVLKVGETEPEKVKGMFLGKLMVCEFPKGKFNPGFFKLAWGLEYCEGTLKDAILAILTSICPTPCEEALTNEEILKAISSPSLTSEIKADIKESFPYWLPPILLLALAISYYTYKRKKEK